jgi:hypothetical protein
MNVLQISHVNHNDNNNNNNDNNNRFEFIGNYQSYFIRKMSEFSKEASPDFNMLNQIYSDKIQELFLENEKLNNIICEHKSQIDKIKELEKINEENKFKIKDKEVYIENMNGKKLNKNFFL